MAQRSRGTGIFDMDTARMNGGQFDGRFDPGPAQGGQACGNDNPCLGGDTPCNPDGGGPAGGWSFVGEGRGGYEKVETLVWVGEGNGSFDKEAEPAPVRPTGVGRRSQCYVGIMVCLVLSGAACLVASLLTGPEEQHGRFAEARAASPTPVILKTPAPVPGAVGTANAQPMPASAHSSKAAAFDCADESSSSSWPQAQRVWCCANKGTGCPELDCEAGYSNWENGWSDGKKVWCCKHKQRGCSAGTTPASTTGQVPYDCTAGLDSWQSGWSDGKKDYCCWHYGRGCPLDQTVASHGAQAAPPPGSSAAPSVKF